MPLEHYIGSSRLAWFLPETENGNILKTLLLNWSFVEYWTQGTPGNGIHVASRMKTVLKFNSTRHFLDNAICHEDLDNYGNGHTLK